MIQTTLKHLKLSFNRTLTAGNSLVDKIIEKDLFTQSAALAYYCALSLAPLLVLTVSLLSVLGPETINKFLEQVDVLIGPESGEIIRSIISSTKENASMRSVSETLGFLVLLFSASSVFNQLKITLTSIFSGPTPCETKVPDQSIGEWFKDRIFSIGIMIGFIFISVSSLLFSVVISLFLSGQKGFLIEVLNQVIFLGIYSLIFGLVFYWVPRRKLKKSDAVTGGIIAAVLFILGKVLIGIYLSSAAVGSAYGAAGSLIVLLIWVYYSSFIFFIAGAITSLLPKIRTQLKEKP